MSYAARYALRRPCKIAWPLHKLSVRFSDSRIGSLLKNMRIYCRVVGMVETSVNVVEQFRPRTGHSSKYRPWVGQWFIQIDVNYEIPRQIVEEKNKTPPMTNKNHSHRFQAQRVCKRCWKLKKAINIAILIRFKIKAIQPYSPPSSVMTSTVVLGPNPSGLNTCRDTKYCVYVSKFRIVWLWKAERFSN